MGNRETDISVTGLGCNMSEATAARFSCGGCNKTYAWKPELAGKRVKCKCGQILDVPQATAQDEEDALYDLAPSEEPVKPKRPAARPIPATAGATPAAQSNSAMLAYQSAPTGRDRMSAQTLMEMKRDVYVPVALLAAGVILYIGCYAFRYHLTGFGIAVTGIGLLLLTALKAALMIGFALVLATPLGVSFGGIWTATLKLAAIAVFCDGVTAWIDLAVTKMTGGVFNNGGIFYGFISWPVALGIYWSLLIYLFSMDPGDSWTVVVLLAIFDRILKMILIFLVLGYVLHASGVSTPGLPSIGSSKVSKASDLSDRVEQLQEYKLLKEAKEYIAAGHQAFLFEATQAWYKAGAKNVWFEVSRDINGHTTPESLIVEMPDDTNARLDCLKIRKEFYEKNKMGTESLTDDGETYMEVRIR